MLEIEECVYEDMLAVYGRTKESMNQDVAAIKEWMKTQSHLPEILDDRRIQNFLLMNKCSVERAKQKIDNYYTIRSLMPDVYENFNPKHPKFKTFTETVYCVFLPKLTKQHYRVFVNKFRNLSAEKFEPLSVIQRVLHLQEIRLSEDYMFGDIGIIDVKGGTLAHVMKFTPTVIVQIIAIYEKVFSLRLRALYLVNAFPAVDAILKLVRKILTRQPKLIQRIHVHSDDKILQEIFDKDMLPADYGGTEKSLEELQNITNNKLEEMGDHFEQFDILRVDENLRSEKLENDDFLGYYGNFKKLDID